ncbi:MAG: rod shape-determining protein RodA [Acetobacteraceae bacterium]|nr:rod shape-determining protein RodA [Acetobacteraceae bacterium]
MRERGLYGTTSFGLISKLWSINWIFVLLLCTLAGIGYAALYSAAGGAAEPYAARHGLRFGFALILMLTIALIDIRIIARFSWVFYAVAIGLLAAVLRFGHVGKGAQRWIELGGLQLQPSELTKIALVMALAHWFHRASWERIGNPFFLILPAIAVAIPVALLLKQPNLGMALVTTLVGGAVFFAAGVRWWKFLLIITPIPMAVQYAYEYLHGYQRARIDSFLNPESDPLGSGYNIIQSKIALGSGGMWGKGFLQGTQGHLNFLPEKQTDFIFTMLGEEFGFVGSVLLLTLLGAIILGGMVMALRCRHQYGRLVALGISVNFSLYVFVNIAMVMGAIPVGGLPLPLVSHGGSAMLSIMIGFGILMSAYVHRDVEFSDGRNDS